MTPRWSAGAADPPWDESGGGGRGAQNHYPLIKSRIDIRDTMLESGEWNPADDAHLYLWVTNTFLEDGLWLMDELGFEYKTTIAWVKLGKWTLAPWATADARRKLKELLRCIMRGDIAGAWERTIRFGIGQYFRGAHELCLFGTRGKGYNVRTEEKGLPGVIVASKGRHSEKPEKFYQLVERRTTGPRVEFFSRAVRPGWRVWGSEVPSHGGDNVAI